LSDKQGCSGGPREDTITGLLVRAPQSEWRKGSIIAVDAGAHLASIVRILELEMPMNSEKLPPKGHETVLLNGPFAGVRFPNISAKANGLFVLRELLHSFLITHPHLDHISAMGINTPALEYGREAKAIVALPHCIEAIKNHIFNDSIWPNLSDEAHGVGFVTYRRLIEGGNPRLGYGEARGYVNVCDGLATKCWAVSHGKCHRQSQSFSHSRGDSSGSYFNDHNGMGHGDGYSFPGRRMSRISDGYGHAPPFPSQLGRDASGANLMHSQGPGTPGVPQSAVDSNLYHPVDSSAFFIRNDATGQEIIVFGDIEPDSVSIHPRNHIVWDDAAPKFVNGSLKAIFIECSFDDSVRDTDLYGHLCPRHLIAELTFFAQRVQSVRKYEKMNHIGGGEEIEAKTSPINLQEPPSPSTLKKKRKRASEGLGNGTIPTHIPQPSPETARISPRVSHSRRKTGHNDPMGARALSPLRQSENDADGDVSDESLTHGRGPMSPPLVRPHHQPPQHQSKHEARQTSLAVDRTGSLQIAPPERGAKTEVKILANALKGLTVHIIHVKDTLSDGPSQGDIILGQLRARGEESGLGCEFDITSCGESIWV
jgi:cAMP phosphodiesterase